MCGNYSAWNIWQTEERSGGKTQRLELRFETVPTGLGESRGGENIFMSVCEEP